MKIKKTIIISITSLLMLFHCTDGQLPEFKCQSGPFGTCGFYNIQTNRSQPNFQPYHEDPIKIYKVYILNTSRMEVLTRDICDYFPRLGELVISNVQNFQGFTPDSIAACRDLSWLYLYGTNVTEIPIDLFKANIEMRHIIVRNTPIKSIRNDQFHGIDMRTLIMVGTNITNFPVDSINATDAPLLKYFAIASSGLVNLELEKLVSRFSNLNEVGYDDNDISCQRVEEMNKLLTKNNITLANERNDKPRFGPTEERDGVICIP